jgi:hypothetical protein
MNCTRIDKLIPLYTCGDLPPLQAEIVREHLRNCAQCNEIAGEFEESREWLRAYEPLGLDDALFDDLRDAVRTEIARAQSRPSLFELLTPTRLALAASAALVLLIIGLAVYLNRHQSIPDPPPAAQNGKEVPAPGETQQRHQDVAANDPDRRKVHRRSSRRTHAKHTLPYFPSPALETIALMTEPTGLLIDIEDNDLEEDQGIKEDIEVLRIEIQTADPNIRIIWLGPKDKSNSVTR